MNFPNFAVKKAYDESDEHRIERQFRLNIFIRLAWYSFWVGVIASTAATWAISGSIWYGLIPVAVGFGVMFIIALILALVNTSSL